MVLDAVSRSFPLIHPSWSFLRIFGDTLDGIDDAERRLFYVALTRAEQMVAIVTDSTNESPYLAEIRAERHLETLDWESLSPAPSLHGARVEVRVSNAREVKSLLMSESFSYSGAPGYYWYRTYLSETFTSDSCKNAAWFVAPADVTVLDEHGNVLDRLTARSTRRP